jgi:hypothetical protein
VNGEKVGCVVVAWRVLVANDERGKIFFQRVTKRWWSKRIAAEGFGSCEAGSFRIVTNNSIETRPATRLPNKTRPQSQIP